MIKSRQNIIDFAFNISNYSIMLLLMFIFIYPLWYMFIYSISDPRIVSQGVWLLPQGFSLFNYSAVLQIKGLLGAFQISVARTIAGTLSGIFLQTLFAYILTKPEMKFRKAIYRILVVTMYFNTGLIPGYLTCKAYGLQNNFLVYILPGCITAFYVVLIKTYIEQLPVSLQEAAMIDGAGYITIFLKVIFPISMPIVATIAVFISVGQWNTWFDNYIYCSKPALQTLQLKLYYVLTEAQRTANMVTNINTQEIEQVKESMQLTPEGVRMTITMVVTLPIVFVYPSLQKYFVKGIMVGAIKG